MNVTDTTRLLLALLYLAAGWFAWWVASKDTILAPVLRFGSSIAFVWTVWYLILMIFAPMPEPWAGHLNRFLHVGSVAFLVAVAWSVRIIRKVRSSGIPVSSRLLGT